jgi:hypothetical protein
MNGEREGRAGPWRPAPAEGSALAAVRGAMSRGGNRHESLTCPSDLGGRITSDGARIRLADGRDKWRAAPVSRAGATGREKHESAFLRRRTAASPEQRWRGTAVRTPVGPRRYAAQDHRFGGSERA